MCVLLDELAAWRNIVTHQHRESPLGLGCVIDGNLAQKPGLRIHGSGPELFVAHFTETLVPLHGNALFAALAELFGSRGPL